MTPRDTQGPRVVEHAEGSAVIETFTVEFDRDGRPLEGFVIGRLGDGARCLANVDKEDWATLTSLVNPEREAIGRAGEVSRHPDGRNLFTFPRELNRGRDIPGPLPAEDGVR